MESEPHKLDYAREAPRLGRSARLGFVAFAGVAGVLNAFILIAWYRGGLGPGEAEDLIGLLNLPAWPCGNLLAVAAMDMSEDRPPARRLDFFPQSVIISVVGTLLWGAIGAALFALVRRWWSRRVPAPPPSPPSG